MIKNRLLQYKKSFGRSIGSHYDKNIKTHQLKDLEVLVVSYGGVGTTFFMRYVMKFMKINHLIDSDGLKHLRFPPKNLNSNTKIIYIYGDPRIATMSLFNRNIQFFQSKKINPNNPITKETTLEEYLAKGEDLFQFRQHFYDWYENSLDNPIMFVRYETIFENIDKIIEFLELPKICIKFFPAKKSRQSKINTLSKKTIENLDKMYGKFAQELQQLKDVEIKNQQGLKSKFYLRPFFRLQKYFLQKYFLFAKLMIIKMAKVIINR